MWVDSCGNHGASPDRLMSCSCCGKACIEMKMPIFNNYIEPQMNRVLTIYINLGIH